MAGKSALNKNFRRRLAGAVAVATVTVGFVGAGVAYADVGFSVPSPSGLTNGQSVQIVLTGINAIPLATVDISECANAYTDNTALATLNPATDCQDLGQIDVSNTPTLTTTVTVTQTGIGLGNRSCISGGNFSCDLRVSQMKNQLTSPLPPPVAISFATNPPAGTPDATTTTVSETGAPAALGKTAYAHVVVASLGNFVPEGDATVELDGVQVASGPVGTDGTVNVALGTPALGDHTLAAQFNGNGSFAASAAPTTTFKVIAATNISVGDVSVVEGDSGFRKIVFPVVLSRALTRARNRQLLGRPGHCDHSIRLLRRNRFGNAQIRDWNHDQVRPREDLRRHARRRRRDLLGRSVIADGRLGPAARYGYRHHHRRRPGPGRSDRRHRRRVGTRR